MSSTNRNARADLDNEVLAGIMSSRTRLRIAELISSRPRSLRELASRTGLSVPGVLRHLEALKKAELIREHRFSSKRVPIRKVYSLRGIRVLDFSVGSLSIVKIVRVDESRRAPEEAMLEALSSEIMVSKRRIREKVRRLARTIDEMIESQDALVRIVESMDVDDDERYVLMTFYSEETLGDAEQALESQGVKEARRSIEGALSKAKGNVSR